MLKFVAAVAACVALLGSADATIVITSSRADFAHYPIATTIDWGIFGPAGTLISTPDARMAGPIMVGVGSSEGVLSRHDEGTDFSGDFAAGDHLLTDAGSQSDSFIVRFGNPIAGFGTQIESDALTGAWTGSIDLYDVSNTLISHVVIGGTRGAAADDTAPFVGILSDAGNISYALFWVDNPAVFPGKSGSLAINRMDVVAGVPEAPAAVLALGGLLLLGTRRFSGSAGNDRSRQGLVK